MPAGRASPQAGAGLRTGARRGRRRPAARIAAAVYVSPELYSLPVSQEFASLRPPLGGRTRLVLNNAKCTNVHNAVILRDIQYYSNAVQAFYIASCNVIPR